MSARSQASRKLEISQFLQSWRPLKEKLEELIRLEKAKIDELTSDAVPESGRDDLNFHIQQKKTLERVFMLVDELKEDLHETEESSEVTTLE
jgi:response regulator of citrate/malate metabolism